MALIIPRFITIAPPVDLSDAMLAHTTREACEAIGVDMRGRTEMEVRKLLDSAWSTLAATTGPVENEAARVYKGDVQNPLRGDNCIRDTRGFNHLPYVVHANQVSAT
jgi:hypothetical protein